MTLRRWLPRLFLVTSALLGGCGSGSKAGISAAGGPATTSGGSGALGGNAQAGATAGNAPSVGGAAGQGLSGGVGGVALGAGMGGMGGTPGIGGALPCMACDDGRISLHDGWNLQASGKIGAKTGAEISTPGFATGGWYPVTVPSTVLAGLIANQVYPDPYQGDNMTRIPASIADGSWWYRTELVPPADFAGQTAWLTLDGVNYRANVWLNGKQLAGSDKVAGTFTSYEWPVTLNAGPNALAIEVFAPDLSNDLAISWLDWNPAPPDRDAGIWQDVYLRKSGSVALRGTHVSSKVASALDSAALTIKSDLTNTGDAPVHTTVSGKLEAITFSQELDLAAHETKTVTFDATSTPALNLQAPRLWWPAQLGKPEMYEVALSASVNGAISDHEGVEFGIRDVTSSLTAQGYRLFKINGKPLLIRGGGWSSDMMLRWSAEKLDSQFSYVRDLGLNTIRLEGKLESDAFYSAADHYGILLIPGWMCCDHWQDWGSWTAQDHQIAAASVHTQARRMRNHPSVIDFLIGSDETPPADVEKEFLDAFKAEDWPNPLGSSAADRTSAQLGKSGLKMPGPYDWVAPSYWMVDTQAGGGFGFNSEAGPGPAVPELETLTSVLTTDQQTTLWTKLNANQFHAGTAGSGYQFSTLSIFNDALTQRLGAPTSLADYVKKAQLMSYEAERAPYEAYSRNKYKNATGFIHWMLNNAWPSLIWHLYGNDLAPAGGYFGAKKANEPLHVLYSYDDRSVVVVNQTPTAATGLSVTASVYNLDATQKWTMQQAVDVDADGTAKVTTVPALDGLSGTYFVALSLSQNSVVVSSNFYFLSTKAEKVNLGATDWYHSPTTTFADYSALATLPQASLEAALMTTMSATTGTTQVTLNNKTTSIAFFTRLKLTAGKQGKPVLAVFWQDNYVSLLPGETRTLTVSYALADLAGATPAVEVSGYNQPTQVLGG